MPTADRTNDDYRDYGPDGQLRLAFICRARQLGFEIADIRSLMGLVAQPEMDCGEVDRVVTGHLEAVAQSIALLERLRFELGRMISQCRSGHI